LDSATWSTLLDDSFSLSIAGLTDAAKVLDLVQYIRSQGDYVVWATALTGLNQFADMLRLEPVFGNYQKFVGSLLVDISNSMLTSNNNQHNAQLLRSMVLRNSAMYENQRVISDLTQLFHNFTRDPIEHSLDPDLRAAVYYTAVEYGGEAEYYWLLNRYRTSNVAAEKTRCLHALSRARQPYLLTRTLELSLNPSIVRSQDTVQLVSLVASNVYGTELAWSFFRKNYREFLNRYAGSYTLGNLILGVTGHFSSRVKFQEVEYFMKEHPSLNNGGSRAINQTLEKISARTSWLENNQQLLDLWLQQWLAINLQQ